MPRRGLVAGAGAVAIAACSAAATLPAPEPVEVVTTTCARSDGLSVATLRGQSLRPGELVLTFDDGPGRRTEELSAWLAAEGISATFFVTGAQALARPGALARLAVDGHTIGNHTQDHLDLTSRDAFPDGPAGDARLLAAVTETHAVVAPYAIGGHLFFRAPYGAYDARAHAVLSASAMNAYLGPIGWDIGGERTSASAADWACWQIDPKLTTKACGDLYVTEATSRGRGIVLFHDADHGDLDNHSLTTGLGNTIDMVKFLVPILRARGFTFVRLADVPEIAALLPPPPPIDAGDAGDAGDAEGDVTTDADASLDAGDAADAGDHHVEAGGAGETGSSGVPPSEAEAGRGPCDGPTPRSEHAH